VLKYYEEHGPAKACSKYDINSCLIYTWKKNGVKTKLATRYNYSDEFVEKALEHVKLKGVKATSMEMQVSVRNLRKWVRAADVQGKYKSKVQYDESFKKEVVDFRQLHGSRAALEKFGVGACNLARWTNKLSTITLCPTTGELSVNNAKKQVYFKSKVVSFAREFGVKAASEKFNVAAVKIWDWKSKEKARSLPKKEKDFSITKKTDYSEEFKKQVMDYFVDHGPSETSRKFSVPRQTVKYWAISRGPVKDRYRVISEEKIPVVQKEISDDAQAVLEETEGSVRQTEEDTLGSTIPVHTNTEMEFLESPGAECKSNDESNGSLG